MKILRNNKIKIFLTVLLVYLFYIAPDYIAAYTNRYVILAKSVVDDRTFNIDKYHQLTRDKAFYKGHYYVGAAPGLGLMAAPIYAMSKPLFKLIPETMYQDLEFNILNLFFSFFLSVLPGALIAVLLYNLLQEFDLKEKERMLTVFACSFGTLLFFYSTKFSAHVMAAFMLFSGFSILFKFKNRVGRKSLYFLAGICLGMAVLLEYAVTLGAILIAIYAFLDFKKDKVLHYLSLALGSSLVAAIFMYYHYKCFDNPFTLAALTHSQLMAPPPSLLPQPKIVFELSFGTYRGMFLYMPILLVSLYGIFAFFKRPEKKYFAEMVIITVFCLSVFYALLLLANIHWPWGGAFGPRHFVCFIPFLSIPIAFAYKKIKYKVIFWIAALSIFINWCGVQYGDTDNVFTNTGLFIFRGLNSNLAQWAYKLTNTYVRELNVITHFSPFIGLIVVLVFIYLIWKTEIDKLARSYFCKNTESVQKA